MCSSCSQNKLLAPFSCSSQGDYYREMFSLPHSQPWNSFCGAQLEASPHSQKFWAPPGHGQSWDQRLGRGGTSWGGLSPAACGFQTLYPGIWGAGPFPAHPPADSTALIPIFITFFLEPTLCLTFHPSCPTAPHPHKAPLAPTPVQRGRAAFPALGSLPASLLQLQRQRGALCAPRTHRCHYAQLAPKARG